jgi:hypothetical protein
VQPARISLCWHHVYVQSGLYHVLLVQVSRLLPSRFVVVQTFVCVCDRRKMVYSMLGLWMEAGSSDFLPRRCSRRGIPVLEFDRVSEDMLPRSDSFNDNGFASGKLLWRSEKRLISDGAASSSGVVVICLPPLWRSLWWCRRRRIDAGFLYRFILSFQYPIFSVL